MNNNVDKNKLKSMVKEACLMIWIELKESYGLKTDSVWYEAFDDAPRREIQII